jgi:hypothetical protein
MSCVKFDYITTSEYATAVDSNLILDCRYLADGKKILPFENILKYLMINMDLSTT